MQWKLNNGKSVQKDQVGVVYSILSNRPAANTLGMLPPPVSVVPANHRSQQAWIAQPPAPLPGTLFADAAQARTGDPPSFSAWAAGAAMGVGSSGALQTQLAPMGYAKAAIQQTRAGNAGKRPADSAALSVPLPKQPKADHSESPVDIEPMRTDTQSIPALDHLGPSLQRWETQNEIFFSLLALEGARVRVPRPTTASTDSTATSDAAATVLFRVGETMSPSLSYQPTLVGHSEWLVLLDVAGEDGAEQCVMHYALHVTRPAPPSRNTLRLLGQMLDCSSEASCKMLMLATLGHACATGGIGDVCRVLGALTEACERRAHAGRQPLVSPKLYADMCTLVALQPASAGHLALAMLRDQRIRPPADRFAPPLISGVNGRRGVNDPLIDETRRAGVRDYFVRLTQLITLEANAEVDGARERLGLGIASIGVNTGPDLALATNASAASVASAAAASWHGWHGSSVALTPSATVASTIPVDEWAEFNDGEIERQVAAAEAGRNFAELRPPPPSPPPPSFPPPPPSSDLRSFTASSVPPMEDSESVPQLFHVYESLPLEWDPSRKQILAVLPPGVPRPRHGDTLVVASAGTETTLRTLQVKDVREELGPQSVALASGRRAVLMGCASLVLALACPDHVAVSADLSLWFDPKAPYASLVAPPRAGWDAPSQQPVRATAGPSLPVMRRQTAALEHFTLRSQALRPDSILPLLRICGLPPAEPVPAEPAAAQPAGTSAVDSISLNQSQHAAFDEAAMLRNGTAGGARLTLIKGPPGTGKTHTSLAILRHWLAMSKEMSKEISKEISKERASDGWDQALNQSSLDDSWSEDLEAARAARAECGILVTGFSNVAIDNIARGLLAFGCGVLRVGRGATSLPSITLAAHIERHTRFAEVSSHKQARRFGEARALELQLAEELLSDADVVLATCITSGGMISRSGTTDCH